MLQHISRTIPCDALRVVSIQQTQSVQDLRVRVEVAGPPGRGPDRQSAGAVLVHDLDVIGQSHERLQPGGVGPYRQRSDLTGFAGTSLDQVAVLARVTKGAVYQHFTNKQALFRAVLELVDERTVTMIASTAGSVDSPWDATLAGLNAFLDRCLDPEYQQICFRDGLTALYGALTAAALTIARAENAQQARNAMGRTMVELLEGLRPAPPKRTRKPSGCTADKSAEETPPTDPPLDSSSAFRNVFRRLVRRWAAHRFTVGASTGQHLQRRSVFHSRCAADRAGRISRAARVRPTHRRIRDSANATGVALPIPADPRSNWLSMF